ncbi:hypothetical protein BCR34DRAFT_185900 [Clohesyomyces aquaticus]|uniref:Uncharacterized protein n=1 Tax=Clohesyomyces aquaticus TaxID=1231657 RepID=A0A1Y1YEP4_9PLEO|nr:hypothetical protein BCR34DRAFT_185900 [Clohesyomyces aquaticus]
MPNSEDRRAPELTPGIPSSSPGDSPPTLTFGYGPPPWNSQPAFGCQPLGPPSWMRESPQELSPQPRWNHSFTVPSPSLPSPWRSSSGTLSDSGEVFPHVPEYRLPTYEDFASKTRPIDPNTLGPDYRDCPICKEPYPSLLDIRAPDNDLENSPLLSQLPEFTGPPDPIYDIDLPIRLPCAVEHVVGSACFRT